ncbi:unnamed protein product, partial [marine sediment metagenome]
VLKYFNEPVTDYDSVLSVVRNTPHVNWFIAIYLY